MESFSSCKLQLKCTVVLLLEITAYWHLQYRASPLAQSLVSFLYVGLKDVRFVTVPSVSSPPPSLLFPPSHFPLPFPLPFSPLPSRLSPFPSPCLPSLSISPSNPKTSPHWTPTRMTGGYDAILSCSGLYRQAERWSSSLGASKGWIGWKKWEKTYRLGDLQKSHQVCSMYTAMFSRCIWKLWTNNLM